MGEAFCRARRPCDTAGSETEPQNTQKKRQLCYTLPMSELTSKETRRRTPPAVAPSRRQRPLRAIVKLAIAVLGVAALVVLAWQSFDREALEALKFTLSLGTILLLVLVLNLAALAIGTALYALVRWLRQDWPDRDDDAGAT